MSALSTPFRIALLLSVSLNLLLAAALAGLVWRQPPTASAEAPGPQRSLPDPRGLERALPPERRGIVREALQGQRRELMASARALRDARSQVQAVLQAPEFDASELAAALAEVRAREQATAEIAHAGLLRLAERLEPHERALLADGIQQHSRHPRRGAR